MYIRTKRSCLIQQGHAAVKVQWTVVRCATLHWRRLAWARGEQQAPTSASVGVEDEYQMRTVHGHFVRYGASLLSASVQVHTDYTVRCHHECDTRQTKSTLQTAQRNTYIGHQAGTPAAAAHHSFLPPLLPIKFCVNPRWTIKLAPPAPLVPIAPVRHTLSKLHAIRVRYANTDGE